MDKYKKLNIVNASALTDWLKTFTWGDDGAIIRYADLKNREYIAANIAPVAKMMTHSYIKKNISCYFNPYVGSEILTPVADFAELSESVRAAIAGGYPAYNFHPEKITPRMQQEILKLNNFLRDNAMNYINGRVQDLSGEFTLDIKYLDTQFKDIMAAVNRAKWSVKMPPTQQSSNLAQILPGREKE